jgi:hypothetical protein
VQLLYLNELEAKDTTNTQMSVSYIVLNFEIDKQGRLKTKLHDKRDYLTFPVVKFPFISSNIPASPAYGVYISQLILYSSRVCAHYREFRRELTC